MSILRFIGYFNPWLTSCFLWVLNRFMITSISLNDFVWENPQTNWKDKKTRICFFLSNDCYTTSLKQTFCLSTNFFFGKCSLFFSNTFHNCHRRSGKSKVECDISKRMWLFITRSCTTTSEDVTFHLLVVYCLFMNWTFHHF